MPQLASKSGQKRSLEIKTGRERNMVFLAVTPAGLEDALRESDKSGAAVWCGADAISEQAYAARRPKTLSRFTYDLGERNAHFLERALDTIEQHHTGEIVWIEAATEFGLP
jgi:hypothetical protein